MTKNIHRNKKQRSKSGLSLVELSIVLVIFGLLISAIAYGMHLVQQAKMMKVGQEFKKYSQMMHGFYGIYREYPGLMRTAFSRWGTKCAATAAECDCFVCDAWGEYYGFSSSNTGTQDTIKVWVHLWLAGFLDREMKMLTGGSYDVEVGTHVPPSVFHRRSGFWMDDGMLRYGLSGSNPKVFTNKEHVMVLGHKAPSGWTWHPLFTPTEAMYLDRKISDGNALTGKLRGSAGGITAVAHANDPCHTTTGEYKTGNKEKACILHYDIGVRRADA